MPKYPVSAFQGVFCCSIYSSPNRWVSSRFGGGKRTPSSPIVACLVLSVDMLIGIRLGCRNGDGIVLLIAVAADLDVADEGGFALVSTLSGSSSGETVIFLQRSKSDSTFFFL